VHEPEDAKLSSEDSTSSSLLSEERGMIGACARITRAVEE
jgi:hypothetical protein